jgi:hypothetical protein
MICTKPVRTIAEFEGLRIHSYGFALPAIVEAIGAVPVSRQYAVRDGVRQASP